MKLTACSLSNSPKLCRLLHSRMTCRGPVFLVAAISNSFPISESAPAVSAASWTKPVTVKELHKTGFKSLSFPIAGLEQLLSSGASHSAEALAGTRTDALFNPIAALLYTNLPYTRTGASPLDFANSTLSCCTEANLQLTMQTGMPHSGSTARADAARGQSGIAMIRSITCQKLSLHVISFLQYFALFKICTKILLAIIFWQSILVLIN